MATFCDSDIKKAVAVEVADAGAAGGYTLDLEEEHAVEGAND